MATVDSFFKIKKSSVIEWGYIFLFVVYIPTFVSRIINIPYWGYICYITIFFSDVYFVLKRKKCLTLPVMLTALFYGYFLLITLFTNTSEFINCFYRTFNGVSFVITLEYLFAKYDIKSTMRIFLKSMEFFNYLNLLSMIIYPAGMYKVVTNGIFEELVKVEPNSVRTGQRVLWLLGHQTLMIRFTLPAICIAIIFIYFNGGKLKNNIRSILLIVVCLTETFIANSAGNYILLVVFLSFMVLFHFRGKIKSWIIYPLIIGIYTFFLTSSGELSVFTWMSNRMQRDVQISTRIPIWLNTLNAWLRKPLFGWGYINESSTEIRELLSLGNPHSSYLWALFEGGLMGIFIFVLYIQFFFKRIKSYWDNRYARVIFAAFLCIIVGMIDDDYIFRFPQELILFLMVYHIPDFAKID